jgi:F420-dependent oxidoreductase-like protein
MPTGVQLHRTDTATNAVDDFIDQARRAHDAGVRHIWLAQQFDHDAIALAGFVGTAVPDLGVGTIVVPVNPRPPLTLASQAQTTQAATHGRFRLGLGLGAHAPEEKAFGVAWPNPVRRLREHLQVLRSINDTGKVDFHGEEFTASPDWPAALPGGTPLPVYVAAMGPKALRVTGELADGTMPYLAGPRTIAEFIRPTIDAAAADAGRPTPEVIAAVPVLVTDDVDEGRAAAADALAFYAAIPSYQRVIAREGVDNLADLAAVGSVDAVRAQLQRYLDAGASELVLTPLRGDDIEQRRLWEVAASI